MISYSKGGNIILSRGLPDVPVDNTEEFKQRSFMKFCKETAPKVIREVYMPSLNKFLESTGIQMDLVGIDVRRKAPLMLNRKCTQKNSQEALREERTSVTWCIYGKFAMRSANEGSVIDYSPLNASAEWVELCSIPYVDEDGFIIYDRYDNGAGVFKKHAYNFIQQVELLPSISFGSKDSVTVRCHSGKSLVFYMGKSKNDLRARTTKSKHVAFAQIVAYLGFKEAMTTRVPMATFNSVYNEIYEDIHYYGSTQCNERRFFDERGTGAGGIEAKELKNIAEEFLNENGNFTAKGLRGALNEFLSLYRAEGLVTAYDVKDSTGSVVVSKGTMLTKADIENIYNHNIFKFHVVQERPKSVYFNDTVFIRFIPKGTKNSTLLRKYLPEERSMYISQDYVLDADNCIMFRSNTELNSTIWNLLLDVKYDMPIAVKNSKSSKNIYNLYLNREIYSNFYKPAGSGYEEWEYVGPFGMGGGDKDKFNFGDLVALYSFLPQALNHLHDGWLPDADACFIKHFTTINQMFERALKDTSTAFFRTYTHYLKDIKTEPRRLLKADTTDNCTWPAFALFVRKLNEYKCLELVDEKAYVNPMAYESARHKANVYVANKHSIADEQRQMALTSYGRFDSYEVPQSGRLGIVNYLTQSCRQTDEGVPVVAYYPLKNGRVCFNEITYLTAQEEAKYIITDIGVLKLDGERILNDLDEIVNCRVPSVGAAKSTIEPQRVRSVQYVNADPDCTLGYTCGSIPFSCSNDAIRATFAVAQIKEAKASQNLEKPGVTTTITTKLEQKKNPFSICADREGMLVRVTSTECAKRGVELKCLDKNGKAFSYYAWGDVGGSESLSRLKLNCKVGQTFKPGDFLCTSEFVDEDGHIRLGMETCVAYIPDTGYNYEDGVSISPAYAERARSLSVHAEVVYHGKGRPVFEPQPRRYYHRDDTIEIKVAGQTTPKYYTLTESGYYYDSKIETDGKVTKLTIYFLANENADVGDKFSDRDGNKGVVTHVMTPNENYTLSNGYPIEVARNPLGVATRLNIGQIRECRVGWAWKILGKSVEIQNFSHDAEDVDTIVSFAYDLANAPSAETAVAGYRSVLPADLIQLGIERYSYAQKWKGVFERDGSCYIYLNGEKRPTKVYAGFVYMLKLVQEVRSKISYRAGEAEGERYMVKQNSPTKGRKSGGGQRLGSMEVAAYCAYGAEAWLNEMFKYRSDDGSGRLAFAMDKYYGDKSYYGEMTQRRAVTAFVIMLASMGMDATCTEKEFIDALTLQKNGALHYPKLNSIRSDMSFSTFNRKKVERVRLEEDKFDENKMTEAEVEDKMYVMVWLNRDSENPVDLDNLSDEDWKFVVGAFLGDEDKARKFITTVKEGAGKYEW